jgi:hypothetical protein
MSGCVFRAKNTSHKITYRALRVAIIKKRSASIRVLSLGPCSWTAIRRHPPAIDFVSNSPPYKSTNNIERKRAEVE